jgi:exosortase A-associated hydrolase 2
MAAITSRALAADGWAVLQLDLLGCGDSSGDFADATWQAWIDDVVEGADWLRDRHPGAPLWLWGLRAGALLAAAALNRLPAAPRLLLWQPSTQGKVVLQQFLRLKAASDLAAGGGKEAMAALRAEAAAGRPVNVAGYSVSTGLYQGLQAAGLAPLPVSSASAGAAPRLVWMEVATQPSAGPGPAAQAGLDAWAAAGWSCAWLGVQGPSFWQTVEIEDAPALVDATRSALAGQHANIVMGTAG